MARGSSYTARIPLHHKLAVPHRPQIQDLPPPSKHKRQYSNTLRLSISMTIQLLTTYSGMTCVHLRHTATLSIVTLTLSIATLHSKTSRHNLMVRSLL